MTQRRMWGIMFAAGIPIGMVLLVVAFLLSNFRHAQEYKEVVRRVYVDGLLMEENTEAEYRVRDAAFRAAQRGESVAGDLVEIVREQYDCNEEAARNYVSCLTAFYATLLEYYAPAAAGQSENRSEAIAAADRLRQAHLAMFPPSESVEVEMDKAFVAAFYELLDEYVRTKQNTPR